jgi:abortive infection bacteriophage resistance protein
MHTWGHSAIWGSFHLGNPKEFKAIDEQLEILKNRGLIVEDEEKAKAFLLKNNYYRISGFSLTLRDHDSFYPHTTFQHIIDIYNFDRKFRNLLLKVIEGVCHVHALFRYI